MTVSPTPLRAGTLGPPAGRDLTALAIGVVVAAVTAACLLAVQFGVYVVNGLALVSALLAAGLALFLLLPGTAAAAAPLQRLLVVACVATFAAALLTLPFAVMTVDGRGLVGLGDGLAREVALRSSGYEGVLTRCGGAIALVLAVHLADRPRWSRWLLVAGAGLVSGSFLFTGHPRTAAPVALALAAAFAHLVAASAWFGGLVGLGVALRVTPRDDLAALLLAFARRMTGVLALLFAGGLGLALLCLSSPGALLRTAYGQVLLVKLAVLVGILVLSSANHRRLVPLAARGRADALPTLRLNVTVEQVGLLAVIIITEILVHQNPGG